MGKASLLFLEITAAQIPEKHSFRKKSYQFFSFYGRMGAAKPACPWSRLKKAL
ncbi:hypothetical protein OBV_10640 [Oscillibacter valericigenes Sjm18-20]|nr:hypothetical protein OBV_10640 [Oscillibacter valericigenes Sjm18-20]